MHAILFGRLGSASALSAIQAQHCLAFGQLVQRQPGKRMQGPAGRALLLNPTTNTACPVVVGSLGSMVPLNTPSRCVPYPQSLTPCSRRGRHRRGLGTMRPKQTQASRCAFGKCMASSCYYN